MEFDIIFSVLAGRKKNQVGVLRKHNGKGFVYGKIIHNRAGLKLKGGLASSGHVFAVTTFSEWRREAVGLRRIY